MNKIILFIGGALVGAGVSYFILEKKYKEEIEELSYLVDDLENERIDLKNRLNKIHGSNEEIKENIEIVENIVDNYQNISNEYKSPYDTITYEPSIDDIEDLDDDDSINVINLDLMGLHEEYEEETLYYTSDYVLTNDDCDILDEDETVGSKAIETMNKDGVEQVCIQNNKNKKYYWLLLSEKTYDELYGEGDK